ncbi:alpha/beta fold hydrolase [Parvibaculum sedimenti]|uniref:Alpha/beta fold hydrolase n=1 Tax=Parvibaculum sedimenti TaxID=2608632 RepID=A0A6N6VG40_9HYPH|nr:alpha/beta hydrolase [Parvibaculum sedimenti]KAB7738652.1 alpha/beta fold hydrolase [Parvibaculum sedimenti]
MMNINMISGCVASGRERTIMLIHGMWSRPDVWANFQHYFEDRGYRVVTPILRHRCSGGDTHPHPDLGTTSLLDYAADLEADIRKLDEPPFIIGHSMGGLLTQMLAARGLLRAGVLLASAHCGPIVAINSCVARIFASTMLRRRFWEKPQLPSYRTMRWGVLNGCSEEEAVKLYTQLIPESGRALAEIAFNYLDPHRASLIRREEINCPLLFLTGRHDRITSPVLAKRNAEYIGAMARFELLPGHAHWLPSEDGWQKIAERAALFLEHEAARIAAEVQMKTGTPERAPARRWALPA